MVKSLRRRDVWWLLTLLALGLAVIVVGAWRAHLTHDTWFDGLWLDVAKAGVQLVAVGVLGGALAAVWRNITVQREMNDREIAEQRELKAKEAAEEREREIERNDKIRAELISLVALYNSVKSIRRVLRSLGMDLKTYPEGERDNAMRRGLTSEQAEGFHAQMQILSKLQLDFESKAKQFGQTNFLDDDTDQVVKNLGRIENHLNHILWLWEQRGWTIREGTSLGQVSDGLVRLFRVGDHMRPEVTEPLREITRLINKHVFGEATERTQNALADVLSEHGRRDRGKIAPPWTETRRSTGDADTSTAPAHR
jgi:hypothetical protein